MEILKFKTNIKSKDDLQKITALLDEDQNIHKWSVDAEGSEHILNASGKELDPQLVMNLLQQAGFQAEFIQAFGAGGRGL